MQTFEKGVRILGILHGWEGAGGENHKKNLDF